ncbi:MAG: hypothetical protein HEP71_05980 [Roseivirga sp.]|nr:hypothetical protein [Roseivirga sp.]
MKGWLKVSGLVLLTMCMGACTGNGEGDPLPADSLAALVQQLGLPIQKDSLIACAASGQHGFLQEDSGLPVSVIYLPVANSGETWYYESAGPVTDKTDLSQYQRQSLQTRPLLNGFLRKLVHPGRPVETVGIVATVSNGKLFLSNEINIKSADQPTAFNTGDISVDLSSPLMPSFQWPVSPVGEDAIYFHVVSDPQNNLVSGTYSFDRNFRFYDLSNVVLNINDKNPPPVLNAGGMYTFSVMAVSPDNWVNAFWSKGFEAECWDHPGHRMGYQFRRFIMVTPPPRRGLYRILFMNFPVLATPSLP